jgi:hypothetical protein
VLQRRAAGNEAHVGRVPLIAGATVRDRLERYAGHGPRVANALLAWEPYNGGVENRAQAVGWLVLLVLLVVLLYPTLFLGQQVAPEATLHSAAPWRLQWGPHPEPSPLALEAATGLGSRLAGIAREGMGLALWNPYVGGGRPGWLVSAREGGAPLTLLAAFLAAPGWTFTALVTIEILAAFGAVFLLLKRLRLEPWAAGVAATGYALSGAVTSHLLDASGSALVLGPLALLPALVPIDHMRRRILAWSAVLVLLLACGPTALAFLALGVAFDFMSHTTRAARPLGAVAIAAVVALAVLSPRFALRGALAEPGAAVARTLPAAPLASLAALVRPSPTAGGDGPYAPGADLSDPNVRGEGFLGLPLLLLAVLGIGATFTRAHAFWPATAGVAAGLAFAPSAVLAKVGMPTRPAGVFALAVAVLAAFGLDHVITRLSSPRGRAAAGAVLGTVLFVRMLPPAAAHLPFAPIGENRLESPLPRQGNDLTGRVAALVDTLPPDVAEVLALPDVRAADLDGEPRYTALLSPDPNGLLPADRAFATNLARLGDEWLLEPRPLRIVSGQIFAQASLGSGTLESRGPAVSTFRLSVPHGATRLGLARDRFTGSRLELISARGRTQLTANTALADESAAWTWVAMPHDWPAGLSRLRVAGPDPPTAHSITVAWDTSGLLLDHEAMGVRVWRRRQVWPPLFLADPGMVGLALRPSPARGGAKITRLTNHRIEANVDAAQSSVLVALVKFRPMLWHATVDGVEVPVERIAEVWSAVPLASGRHRVILSADLPAAVWAASLGGLAFMLILAAWRKRG